MLAFAPDYDHLPLIAKVEVFQHALQNTEGNDLAKVLCWSYVNEYAFCIYDSAALFYVNKLWQVLWLKSRTSEVWLERRTNYTRSLAVMSMV